MSKKKSKLATAREQAEAALKQTNEKIADLGEKTSALYDQLCTIQAHFDKIRNVPSDEMIRYEKLKEIRLSWKQQAEKIEADYKAAEAKGAGGGAAGVSAGVAVAALGPSVAMGIATTFGVASTGTAISSLSGAAATNAALAWLGGGALAAGGGGMAAGNAILALAGPIGWAIAGVSMLCSGFFIWKSINEKHRLEDIFSLISDRDTKKYNLATVELNERITRTIEETALIKEAIVKIQTFGLDYEKMSECQQYELGDYVNLMNSSTQLLVNPILGLTPWYTEEDYTTFCEKRKPSNLPGITASAYKDLIIALSNLFYSVEVDEKDHKLIYKSFKKNKKFLQAVNVDKKNFAFSIIEDTFVALKLQKES